MRTEHLPLLLLFLSMPALNMSADEMKVFDWNGPSRTTNRGFPVNQPPTQNGNWVTPMNYAQGTFHIRMEIRSQPIPQSMKLQFCVWQEKDGDNYGLESCTNLISIRGDTKEIVTTSQNIESMWKKDGNPIEWDRERFRVGIAIKNAAGEPVSDYNGWNWYGENPKEWYPLDMRYTVVVVAQGSTFSGWQNYSNESAPQNFFGNHPHSIPGKIEAEDYDLGGPGVAFYDMTAGNSGGFYRSDDVDLGANTASTQGRSVRDSATNEWLEYTAHVTEGTYALYLNYASGASNPGDLEVMIGDAPNGTNLSPIATFTDITNTGGWSNYTTTKLDNVNLTGGSKVIRLKFVNGADFDIDWVRIIYARTPPVPGLHVDWPDSARVYWDYDSSITYRLEKSTNLSDWSIDTRPMTQEGHKISFEITPTDILVHRFFKVVVDYK